MTDQFIKLQTSIRPELLKKNLIFTVGVALIGIAILILAYIYMPERQMKFIGPLIVIVWMFLTIGTIRPYMMLKMLERKPQDLILKDTVMIYNARRIPFENLEKIHYYDTGDTYGILLDLKNGEKRKLSFFSKKDFDTLKEHLKAPPEGPDIRDLINLK